MEPPAGGRKARRTGSQRLLIAFNVVLALACLAAAGGLSFIRTKLSEVNVVSLGVSLTPTDEPDAVRNVLLIGTDSADRLPEDDAARINRDPGGLLADVIMILRLDPGENSASLLSIPRDTYVPIAGSSRSNKINTAIYGVDGQERLIRTIKQNFGISIDNYAQVDFRGFRDLIDVLDGVPMYITTPIRDPKTGLNIEETGCVLLDPVQSLAYARSRHLQYRDPETGEWTDDPSADLGRINRQQAFLQRAAQRAVSKGARNPASAFQLVDAAVKVVTIDETMTLGEIKDVVDRFRNFNVDTLAKYQLPTTVAGDASFSYLNVNWDEAEPVLDVFRGTADGTLDVADVQVSVGPSSAPAGDASKVVAALEDDGFDADLSDRAEQSPSGGGSGRTTIYYGERGRDAAVLLARYLDADVRFRRDTDLRGVQLRLDPGADLTAVRTEPLDAGAVDAPPTSTTTTEAAPSPDDTLPPDLAPATEASTTTVPETSSTIGFLPVDDEKAKGC